jgi:uncharacterized membrane protein
MPTMTWRRAGLFLGILYFFAGGIAHFVFATAESSIIPPYVPYPGELNYLVGALEILGAIGLGIPLTRRAAGFCLILLTICVTPANVFMLQHADRFPELPIWALALRLPVQVLLILLLEWSSRVSLGYAALRSQQ